MSTLRASASGRDLTTRLRELVEARRVGAVRPLLNAILRLLPQDSELAELHARVRLLEGDAPGACAVLDAALARAPEAAALWLARAGARAQAGDTAGAARDAAEAVVRAPGGAAAKALLGALLHKLGRPQEARACLQEALAAAPGDGFHRRQLAAAQAACGDPDAASATLEEGLARAPGDVGLRTTAVLARLRRGDAAGAEQLALAARRAGAADAAVLGLLGHARSMLGRHAEAAEAYGEARKLAPEDAYLRHLAATGGFAPDAGRATEDYVRVVFDGYAAGFDEHLITLGYRVPGLIRAELLRLERDAFACAHPSRSNSLSDRAIQTCGDVASGHRAPGNGPRGPVLDLGCGTGLLAVAAAAETGFGPWIGVDLSPGMLAQAARRGLYAELHEADIERFLAAQTRAFPLVLAGDVLPYFGDLGPLLSAVAARLTPGGRFLFTVEYRPDEIGGRPWELGALGRYAHSVAHIATAAAAAGLTVAAARHEVVRLEHGCPVPGLIVTLASSSESAIQTSGDAASGHRALARGAA